MSRTMATSPQFESTPLKRLYSVWPARSKFLCGGRCYTGPCVLGGMIIWLIIFVPVVVYCVVILPKSMLMQPVLSMASLCLFANMLALLLATACSEPGVIPKRAVIEELGIADDLSDVLGYNLMGVGEPTRDSKTDQKNMLPEELQDKGFSWCRTCEIIRPPRASHCRVCDICVLRFDHHCPILNNCIAQRNYSFFVGFLCSILFSAIFGVSVTLWWTSVVEEEARHAKLVAKQLKAAGHPLEADPFVSVSASISSMVFYIASAVCILSLCVLGFLGYHLFLVYTGKTTKEFKVKAKDLKSRPTLCAARGPPLFDPQALVEPRALSEALKRARDLRRIMKAKADEEAARLKEQEAKEGKSLKSRVKEDVELDPEEVERRKRRRALRQQRMEERRRARQCCQGVRLQEFKSKVRRLHYNFMKSSCPPRCWRLDVEKAKVHIDV